MGHGLGPAQRAVLAVLADTEDVHPWLSVRELAAALKLSERRTRALVASLEARELVTVIRSAVGWRGAGEYGRLVGRGAYDNRPVVLTLSKGDRDGVEFVRQGMPVYGLHVWLSVRYAAWEARIAAAVAAHLRPADR